MRDWPQSNRYTDEVRDAVIEDLTNYLYAQARTSKGAKCICGRKLQSWTRILEKQMAYGLTLLERYTRHVPEAYVHVAHFFRFLHSRGVSVPPTLLQGGHLLNAVHLKALKRLDRRTDGKSSEGFYHVEPSGRSFATEEGTLPSWALIYHRTTWEVSGERITLDQALRRETTHVPGMLQREIDEADGRLLVISPQEPLPLPADLVYVPYRFSQAQCAALRATVAALDVLLRLVGMARKLVRERK
jgi:hypothetical protein